MFRIFPDDDQWCAQRQNSRRPGSVLSGEGDMNRERQEQRHAKGRGPVAVPPARNAVTQTIAPASTPTSATSGRSPHQHSGAAAATARTYAPGERPRWARTFPSMISAAALAAASTTLQDREPRFGIAKRARATYER